MRIRHTVDECYKVYNLGSKHWVFWKLYSSKSSALAFVKKAKLKYPNLCWKIVWFPHPFCCDDDCITVYSEEV